MALAYHSYQWKPYCSSQASIGHNELFFETDRLYILPQHVDQEAKAIDGDKPDNQTEQQSPADKASVPNMLLKESHSKVEEDDAVTGGTEHLDEVIDSGQGLWGDILESIMGLNDTTTYQADDPSPMNLFCSDVL